jgi:hypothetical protein
MLTKCHTLGGGVCLLLSSRDSTTHLHPSVLQCNQLSSLHQLVARLFPASCLSAVLGPPIPSSPLMVKRPFFQLHGGTPFAVTGRRTSAMVPPCQRSSLQSMPALSPLYISHLQSAANVPKIDHIRVFLQAILDKANYPDIFELRGGANRSGHTQQHRWPSTLRT